MINLITGLPGHGKSLYTLWHVKNRVDKENKELIAAGKEPRQVFYNGIPDLKLDWQEFPDADKWHELPSGSIIVIDEAQRSFRPRGNASAVPLHVSKLETHRHQGFDLYVITQHPLLLDGNLRRLVDRHYHVHRPFGWSKSTVLDFQGVKDQPMQRSNRGDAQKSVFAFPKELYSMYKSAEVHTAKARLPGKMIFLLMVPLLLGGMGWYAWHKLKQAGHIENTGPTMTNPTPGLRPDPVNRPQDVKMTKEEYLESWTPRIAGMQHTSPRYDEVTKPVRAPYPDACIASAKSCKCYSQQGTALDIDSTLCRQIVDKGFFKDFEDNIRPNQTAVIPASQSSPAVARDQVTMMGGTPPASLDPRYGTYAANSATTGAAASRETDAATVGRNTAVALNR